MQNYECDNSQNHHKQPHFFFFFMFLFYFLARILDCTILNYFWEPKDRLDKKKKEKENHSAYHPALSMSQ